MINFFAIFTFLLMIIGHSGPFFEKEPLYGTFAEEIVMTEEGIFYKNIFYPYNKIQDFNIKLTSYYKKNADNIRIGPKYLQGIDNEIFFIANDIVLHERFLISSGTQFDTLQNIINKVICEEKIPFKSRYLDLISNDYKTSPHYLDFIKYLKEEKRISAI